MGSNDIAVEIVGRVESATTTVKAAWELYGAEVVVVVVVVVVVIVAVVVGANARATTDDILSFLGAICVPAWMGVNFAVMCF